MTHTRKFFSEPRALPRPFSAACERKRGCSGETPAPPGSSRAPAFLEAATLPPLDFRPRPASAAGAPPRTLSELSPTRLQQFRGLRRGRARPEHEAPQR